MRIGSFTLTSLITLGSDCPLEWKVQSKQMAVIAACLDTSSLWSLLVTGNPVLASKSLRVMKGASTTFTHRFPNLWIPFIKGKLLYIMHQLLCSSRYLSKNDHSNMQWIVLTWCFRLAFHRSSQHSIRLLFLDDEYMVGSVDPLLCVSVVALYFQWNSSLDLRQCNAGSQVY